MYTADNKTSEYKLIGVPDYVGYWELVPAPSAFRVFSQVKPKWFHRKMIKLFFGWTWHETV